MGREFELKLVIPAASANKVMRLPWLWEQASGEMQPRQMSTTYFDTPKYALRQKGISLRVRRVGAKNRWTVVGRYVSGNVAVIKTELQIGYVEASGVDRVIVWCIYETKGDKIAAVTLAGQRTDPQTARFIEICCSSK